MSEEVVTIPKSLFDRMCIRLGIESDAYARKICIELEKYVDPENLYATLFEDDLQSTFNEVKIVDSVVFEIGEG